MDDTAKKIIDFCIVNDEGGWKLTSNKDDPDGGWTYAGVTARVYEDEYQTLTYERAKMFLPQVHDNIYQIYFDRYYVPLNLDKLPQEIRPALFSCAVNCGVGTAVKILQGVIDCQPDGICGPNTVHNCNQFKPEIIKTEFLREWTRHYINLIQENAEAWRDAAKTMFAAFMAGGINTLHGVDLPKVLYAANLEGWFNRVERYR